MNGVSTKDSHLERLSKAFWEFIEQPDWTNKLLFALVLLFSAPMGLYLLANKIVSSEMRVYYDLAEMGNFLTTLKFYAALWAAIFLLVLCMKALRLHVRYIAYLGCIMASFVPLHISLYLGIYEVISPFLLVLNLAFIVLLFGPKFGKVSLAISIAAYLTVILLDRTGHLTVPSILKRPEEFWEVYRKPKVAISLAAMYSTFIVIFGLFFIHLIAVINEKTEQTQALSSKLSQYLPKLLVNLLANGAGEADKKHERKRLTIFLSDIKDFTQISETLQPEELSRVLNLYLTRMSRIAHEFGGTVDKFIGDAILVYFGGIGEDNYRENALKAVRMAIAMQEEMKNIRAQLDRDGFDIPFHIRIGINTGYVTIGSFGSEDRMDYTIIGKEVNVASRLEGICEPDGVLVSHSSYALVRDDIQFEAKGEVKVKGIQDALRVYQVVLKNKPS